MPTSSSAITNAHSWRFTYAERKKHICYTTGLDCLKYIYVLALLKCLIMQPKELHISFTYYILNVSIEKTEKNANFFSRKVSGLSHSLPHVLVVYSFLKTKSENKTSPEILVWKLQIILWALYIDIPQLQLYNTSTEL